MQVVALVDCNSFFVSCERVFAPELIGKPVIVLSNNDGCIISRSEEAKALGLKFDPYFKVKDICEKNNVKVFSANFALYADMSKRVMNILKDFTQNLEIYSIDEAFLDLSHIPSFRLAEYAEDIRNTILRNTSIPVSIGVSSTKSLAKAAQFLAKKSKSGVNILFSMEAQNNLLSSMKPSEIWGIGESSARILRDLGIKNAAEFRDMDSAIVRKYLKLSGHKLQCELKGMPCSNIEQSHEKKQNITISRSFSKNVTKLEELEYAVGDFAAKAAAKLRAQGSVTNAVCVFIRTSNFDMSRKYAASTIEYMDSYNSDSPEIIKTAKLALRKIFKPGFDYKKAGIILINLADASFKQLSFQDLRLECQGARESRSQIIDEINKNFRKDVIFFLGQGITRPWSSRSGYRSPAYTSDWRELLVVR